MYKIFFILLLNLLPYTLTAISTTRVKRNPQPVSLSQQFEAQFGNQVIRLTDTEYRQLIQLPPLNRIIASNQTAMTKDLVSGLLSHYQLSRPKIYCIRAPCPQPAIINISNDSINIEIPLTNSDFSQIIESLNI